MKNQIIIKRYAQGFVQAVADETEFAGLNAELARFQNLLQDHDELRNILINPFLPFSRRNQIIRDVVASSGLKDKAARFVLLLVKHNRLHLLPRILEALPAFWDERHGVVTFEVTSVVPLTERQKAALTAKLKKLEKKPVRLELKLDPSLLGGICLKKGHIIYDVSLRSQLSQLRNKMSEGL